MKPFVRNYQQGSFVYLEGNVSDEIYVLNNGRIILEYMDIIDKAKKIEDLSKGDFFGVRSVLGRSPRIENAKVVVDSEVLVMKEQYFMEFCRKSPKLVSQMLKIYSSELRTVHLALRNHLEKTSKSISPAVGLFNCGKFYYKRNNTSFAKYTLEKYKESYPKGVLLSQVNEILNAIKKGIPYSELFSSL